MYPCFMDPTQLPKISSPSLHQILPCLLQVSNGAQSPEIADFAIPPLPQFSGCFGGETNP